MTIGALGGHINGPGQQSIGSGAAGWLLNFYPFLRELSITPRQSGAFGVVVDYVFDGFSYSLKRNPGLDPGDWEDLETIIASGNVVIFSHTPSVGVGKEFFRVVRAMAP